MHEVFLKIVIHNNIVYIHSLISLQISTDYIQRKPKQVTKHKQRERTQEVHYQTTIQLTDDNGLTD